MPRGGDDQARLYGEAFRPWNALSFYYGYPPAMKLNPNLQPEEIRRMELWEQITCQSAVQCVGLPLM